MESTLVSLVPYVSRAVLEPLVYGQDPRQTTSYEERRRLHALHPPGARRRLQKVARFDQSLLDSQIVHFIKHHGLQALLTENPYDLTIPCAGLLSPRSPRRFSISVKRDADVTENMRSTILKTAQTIYHQMDMARCHAKFGLIFEPEPKAFPFPVSRTPFVFADWDPQGIHFKNAKLAVFIFPPWALDPHDLARFSVSNCFDNNQPFDITSLLWAMIYDFCHRHHIHHFIISDYETWVFGIFSANWSTGFTRPIMRRDCHSPTILQTLIFWLHAGNTLGRETRIEIPNSKSRTREPWQTPTQCQTRTLCPLPTSHKMLSRWQ